MKGDADDPKALIREAYKISGITAAQCRSIFLDWALGWPAGQDQHAALTRLVAQHGAAAPDHPMTAVLLSSLQTPPVPRRRGGRAARRG